MSLRKILELTKATGDTIGKIASPFYMIEDTSGKSVWACDVDLGGDTGTPNDNVLRNVPIATNNRDILYAEVGKPVALRRVGQGGYEIVGLSKHCVGNTHIMYVNFTDQFGEIVNDEMKGSSIRMLRYEEFILYGGYGVLPYGVMARFDADGNFLNVIM